MFIGVVWQVGLQVMEHVLILCSIPALNINSNFHNCVAFLSPVSVKGKGQGLFFQFGPFD